MNMACDVAICLRGGACFKINMGLANLKGMKMKTGSDQIWTHIYLQD